MATPLTGGNGVQIFQYPRSERTAAQAQNAT